MKNEYIIKIYELRIEKDMAGNVKEVIIIEQGENRTHRVKFKEKQVKDMVLDWFLDHLGEYVRKSRDNKNYIICGHYNVIELKEKDYNSIMKQIVCDMFVHQLR